MQALSSSCAAATSWLPATCEFPSTLPTRGGSTVPVSRPIAYALPVPIHCAASGVPFGVLRQAEHVSPIRFTSASKMVLRTHPHWWRKVRDSNPRIVVTIAALAVRCFQPDSANLPVCLAIPSQGLSNNCPTSQVLNLTRCEHSLNLIARIEPCISMLCATLVSHLWQPSRQ